MRPFAKLVTIVQNMALTVIPAAFWLLWTGGQQCAMGVNKALEARENAMDDSELDAIGAGDQV